MVLAEKKIAPISILIQNSRTHEYANISHITILLLGMRCPSQCSVYFKCMSISGSNFSTSHFHTASYAEYSSGICFQTIRNVTNHASRPASSNSDSSMSAGGNFTLAAVEVPYGVGCCAQIVPHHEAEVFNSRNVKEKKTSS